MPQQRHARDHRGRHWLDNALTTLIVTSFLVCVAAVASGNFQIRPVLSGSMRPDLPVGGVVITHRVPTSDVHVGDVIVFREPDGGQGLVVHRVYSEALGPHGAVLHTKGDANGAPDPWTITLRGEHAYRAVFAVPFVGYAAVWAHNPAGSHALIAVGVLLLALSSIGVLMPWRRGAQSAPRSRARRMVRKPPAPDPLPRTSGLV